MVIRDCFTGHSVNGNGDGAHGGLRAPQFAINVSGPDAAEVRRVGCIRRVSVKCTAAIVKVALLFVSASR